MKDRTHIDIVDAIELFFGDLQHRLVAMGPAGVVDDDVELAAEGDGRRDGGLDVGRLGHVALDRPRCGADRFGGGFGPSPFRSMMTTFAPSRAKVAAISAPKPDAVPVTSAVLPFNLIVLSLLAISVNRA